jgi:hypothetical protein
MSVLANDSAGGTALDPSTLTITSPPNHASIYAIEHGVIVYASDPTFHGQDTMQYRVCDVDGLCTSASVTIAVS